MSVTIDAFDQEQQQNYVVTKANSLVEASYMLSLHEQRIILACAAQLDGRRPLPKENRFTLTADEYAERFGIDRNSVYRHMKDAVDRLYERDIRKIRGEKTKRFRWVYMAEYEEGSGSIRLGFSPEIAPYLSVLQSNFTKYSLAEVANINSAYSIRLFEMMMQYKSTGVLLVDLAELRERLQLEDKYPRFSNFKQRVIVPAVKELNQKTNISVSWEPIMDGKTVKRLRFSFEEKPQMELL